MRSHSWNHWHHSCDSTWEDDWSDNTCECSCQDTRPATLTAQVLDTRCGALLVCDCENSQKVQVNTDDACSYSAGDRLCIRYNGVMTNSLPPQISATDIRRVGGKSGSCSGSNRCSC